MTTERHAHLICGGEFHDFAFAQDELLSVLAEEIPGLKVTVGSDYRDHENIAAADLLLTYTNNVIPDVKELSSLDSFLSGGKRWFALHGTNAVIDFDFDTGKVSAPRTAPEFVGMLGSQFIAHPPVMTFPVLKSEQQHPLIEDLPEFEVEDELYLSEMHGDNEVLLYTNYNGASQRGFEEWQWFDDQPRPLLYIHKHAAGEVLYFMLGHCRGETDMQPYMDTCPVERCAWESEGYYEVLRRGIRWAARMDE